MGGAAQSLQRSYPNLAIRLDDFLHVARDWYEEPVSEWGWGWGGGGGGGGVTIAKLSKSSSTAIYLE